MLVLKQKLPHRGAVNYYERIDIYLLKLKK